MTDRPQGYGEPHILFAQALVQVARDHGVHSFIGAFRLNWGDRERPGWSGDSVSLNWSEGRHGDDSNIVLKCEQSAVVPEIAPNSAMIYPMIYFADGDFCEAGTGKSKGERFRERWLARAADYPTSQQAVLDAMTEENRAWFMKRWKL